MFSASPKVGAGKTAFHVQRFATNPLITPASSPTLGDNINGPSVIRVPDWLPNYWAGTARTSDYISAIQERLQILQYLHGVENGSPRV